MSGMTGTPDETPPVEVLTEEALAEPAQRVGGVERLGVRAVGHPSHSSTARHTLEPGSRCS